MVKRFLVLLLSLCFCFVHTGLATAGVKIVIDKSTNQLQYFNNEILQKTFPIATGKSPLLTPEGNFTVVLKVINPYYSRNGGIPGGSPQNPLGYRWLGLSVGGGSIYGIHGTNNPSSIGTYASAGCIRMYNKDVSWLFDHTPVGTPVKIIHSVATPVPEQPKPLPKPQPVTVVLGDSTIEVNEPAGTSPDGAPILPLRTIFETLGYTIGWDNFNRTILITRGIEHITIAYASGQVTTRQNTFICPELKLVHGTMHAPLSFWQRALPLMQINWDDGQRIVTFSEKVTSE